MKAAWLAARMAMLMGMGFIVLHMQVVRAGPVIAVLNEHRHRVMSDYHAVNKRVKKVKGVMPDLVAKTAHMREASDF